MQCKKCNTVFDDVERYTNSKHIDTCRYNIFSCVVPTGYECRICGSVLSNVQSLYNVHLKRGCPKDKSVGKITSKLLIEFIKNYN
jgi:phage FluMu protein Com